MKSFAITRSRCTCEKLSVFTLNSRTGTCDDINECQTTKHGCAASATCINKIGGHACQCNEGTFGLSGHTCKTCTCKTPGKPCERTTGSCNCFGTGRTGKNCDECFESYFVKDKSCSSCFPHCNMHTKQCNGKSGQCAGCADNTGGTQCGSCLPGYSSDAALGKSSAAGAICTARCRGCVRGNCVYNQKTQSSSCDCAGTGTTGQDCNTDIGA